MLSTLLARSVHTAWRLALLTAVALVPLASFAADDPSSKPLKAGIIGLDTSHVVAFTKLLNAEEKDAELQGVSIVAAFPAGSPDVVASSSRVEGFTETLSGLGVEIVDSIPALLEKVDVVFLESVDGRPHLEQVKPVLEAGKPVFIDKPLAASLSDALEIDALSKKYGTPYFSASSLRFSKGIYSFRGQNEAIGETTGCAAYSPCSLEEHRPDLFWYGVHGVEILFTIMGPGCETVVRTQTPDYELVTGTWSDGRIGTFRGIRGGKAGYGALVYGTKGITTAGTYEGYKPLVVEICKFFRSGKPPVDNAETLEIIAFMQAADASKDKGGCPVKIADLIKEAQGAKSP